MTTILPAAPYLSWVYFGGRKTPEIRCEVAEQAMFAQIDAFVEIAPSPSSPRLAMVQFWEGHDPPTAAFLLFLQSIPTKLSLAGAQAMVRSLVGGTCVHCHCNKQECFTRTTA
jgi:hypothetical protein